MATNIKAEFEGTWRFANEKEEDGWNYLHFSKGNRITQYYNIKNGDFDCTHMLVQDIGDSSIEFFPEDGSPGWTRQFRFDDGNLVIIEKGVEYPCSRPPELLPWLVIGISEAETYFDENEAAWGKKE